MLIIMNTKEFLVKTIQTAVDGCAAHWAEVIADGILQNGTYVPNKREIHIIPEERLTDTRILSGWYQPMDYDERREMLNSLPSVNEIYSKLGDYENLTEDGMLMAFAPINVDEVEE